MTIMTLELPVELVKQIQPVQHYLPTILQLTITTFQTPAAQTASEIVRFLAQNPSPNEVLDYHVPDHAQTRLRELLERNREGDILPTEDAELDDLILIERIIRQVKIQAAKQSKNRTA